MLTCFLQLNARCAEASIALLETKFAFSVCVNATSPVPGRFSSVIGVLFPNAIDGPIGLGRSVPFAAVRGTKGGAGSQEKNG